MIDTPLFVKTHDFVVWLLQRTARFPKHYRHSLTLKLEGACLDFLRILHTANARRARARRDALDAADVELNVIRALLRIALDLKLLSAGTWEHAVRLADELGRLIGGWKRQGTGRK